MTLLEAVMASLLLMLGTSAAAQLWSHGLRISVNVSQREERLDRLEELLLGSEGVARELADRLEPVEDCQAAIAQLLPRLRALSPEDTATLSLPPSPAGTLHLRWDDDGLRRERIFSASVLRLCRGGRHES
ncbi:MAG: hypothetical protein FJ083_05275 [Cyanobacteria bacterium K_Offshore_surface_m2_239]|nr:hypothetical protein [Cyanobacteria bacterium K_Offshore_surface_m2_239]